MELDSIASIGAYILVSLGGAGAIIVGLSSWVGKIWANKFLESEKAKHSHDLEALRSDLAAMREQQSRKLNDRMEVYRDIASIVADMLAEFDLAEEKKQALTSEAFDRFNRNRMIAYGRLALMAPQSLMDKFDGLCDQLLSAGNGETPYVFSEIREHCLACLNEMRKDLGFDNSEITYNGSR